MSPLASWLFAFTVIACLMYFGAAATSLPSMIDNEINGQEDEPFDYEVQCPEYVNNKDSFESGVSA